MDIVEFFAQVVRHADQPIENNQHFKQLPAALQRAILRQDGDSLKTLLAHSAYLANESHVVQIQA